MAMARAMHRRCLLAAGQTQGAGVEAVLHLVPEGRARKLSSTELSRVDFSRTP